MILPNIIGYHTKHMYEPADTLQKAKFNQTLHKSSFHDPLPNCHKASRLTKQQQPNG